ncbi:hypothetical protein [Leptospira barantonii]|uniref:Glycosyltransferase RgtA/B/C/D-like domain-containing protein n=1 Tax=Leptospira barantonii TaxID=2023184 RepID=A0ABX4NPB6_9LEPT|nr:hypothetical protein [Leptospira barantonii]PJZ58684.1 hypothetical protein CH367_01120 [Leptospira barantonii]
MRKVSIILILCLPALYYVGAILSWDKKKKLPITGDEPHYLMISESIRSDGDFDLKNNYEEDHVTKKIIGPVDVENHTTARNGKLYSIHSIGVAILALPGYILSGIKGARIGLAILAGILPFLFYAMGRMFHLSRKEAAALGIFYSISLPFPMAAGQIFPDLPTGILFTLSVTILLFLKTNQTFKNQNILLFTCGFATGIMAWLHAKNLPVVAILLAWGLIQKEWNLRSKTIYLGTSIGFIIGLLICNFLWFESVRGPYGTIQSTIEIGSGTQLNSPPIFTFDLSHWITVFSGLFMDRNQGLFYQNPLIWIPGSLGWIFLFQDKNLRRIGILLLLILILQLGLNAGHPCSYGCLSLPGRFQWSSAPIFFLPLIAGWKTLRSLSEKVAWSIAGLCVAYQIWIGKFWFDHTASLYHTMEANPSKRPGFFPETILPYLPSWTDPELSWRTPINLAWVGIFLTPVLILSYLTIRNIPKGKNGLNPLVDRETK